MQNSLFTKINEGFRCENCGRDVPVSGATCRNHCPFCLHSKHVDIHPGDRANSCGGILVPEGYDLSAKKGIVLRFRCLSCGALTRNKALTEDRILPDDYEAILRLGNSIKSGN